MFHKIEFEWIGWDIESTMIKCGAGHCARGRPIVAEQFDVPYNSRRERQEFVRGKLDFARANSKGSRGVYSVFDIEEFRVYYFRYKPTWGRQEEGYFYHDGEQFVYFTEKRAAFDACQDDARARRSDSGAQPDRVDV